MRPGVIDDANEGEGGIENASEIDCASEVRVRDEIRIRFEAPSSGEGGGEVASKGTGEGTAKGGSEDTTVGIVDDTDEGAGTIEVDDKSAGESAVQTWAKRQMLRRYWSHARSDVGIEDGRDRLPALPVCLLAG